MLGLKDLKRRGVETFLQAVGASDRTDDETYNEEYAAFQVMVSDLNEIGAGLSEYLISLKQNYGLGSDLSAVLNDFYNGQFNRGWTESNPNLSHLTLHSEVEAMNNAWVENDEIVRKSVAHIWLQRGLTPMRAFVNDVMPQIEEACRTRENLRKDADSYRRRYATAQKKAAGANLTPEKRGEYEAHAQVLYNKLTNANKVYEDTNETVKKDLEKAKIARDEAVELMAVTVAACQMELYEQSYLRLQSACANFPQQKMNQVRGQIKNIIRSGGPNRTDAGGSRLSDVKKIANVVTGKKVREDYEKERQAQEQKEAKNLQQAREVAIDDEMKRNAGVNMKDVNNPPPALPKARSHSPIVPSMPTKKGPPPPVPAKRVGAPVPTNRAPPAQIPTNRAPPPPVPAKTGGASSGGPSGGVSVGAMGKRFSANTQPFTPFTSNGGGAGGGAGSAPPIPTRKAPPPAPPKKSGVKTCTAVFDNVADDADELSFNVGDKIEIVRKDDSGWWEGRLGGKVGQFPSNFVKED